MSTATETKAPSLEDLQKQLGETQAKLKALGEQPNFNGVRTDDLGRVTSYFMPTDETVDVEMPVGFRSSARKAYLGQRKQHAAELNNCGYKPWGEFKSVRDMVRYGFEHGSSGKFAEKLAAHCKAIQGMSTVVGSDGGFAVIPEFAPGIIDRVYQNDIWSRTDNYNVSGNSLTFNANAETSRANGSRHGGLRGYWVDQGGTITKSKPTMRRITLELHKLAVIVYLTQELIDDNGSALEQYVTRKASEEFNFMLGDAVFNGDGVGKPLGVMNSPSLLAISAESGQTGAKLWLENVTKMYSRFFMPNYGNAEWYHNQDVLPELLNMSINVGAAGQPVYMQGGNISGAPFGTLYGKPLHPTEFNATLGTTGDIVLADLGQMITISKGGVMQAVSMHLEFLTDQLALRFTMRVNGKPWENAPITPYKGTNTQSSFVCVATR